MIILRGILFAIYTVSCYPIHFLFYLAALLNPRPRAFRLLRINAQKDLENYPEQFNSTGSVYWFHGASVGELDQAKALGRELKTNKPDAFLVLSWMSDSVTEKNLVDSPADYHYPLPLDGPFQYDLAFRKFKPTVLVLFAWDTWAWFIRSAYANGAKVYLACATLGERSARLGFFSRQLTILCFSWLEGILPAHKIHEPRFQGLLESISPDKRPILETLGDTRFDSVIQKMLSTATPPSFAKFWEATSKNEPHRTKPILFASTYPICETGILEFLQEQISSSPTSLPYVWVFPHKIIDHRIESFLNQVRELGYIADRFSRITRSLDDNHNNVIVFDELGILAYAYRFAKFAYVGGGFHHRIHNVIEPAYWGLPICTGPKIENSSEALVLESLGGLVRMDSPAEIPRICKQWMNPRSHESLAKIGQQNKDYVAENSGASARIYKRIFR